MRRLVAALRILDRAIHSRSHYLWQNVSIAAGLSIAFEAELQERRQFQKQLSLQPVDRDPCQKQGEGPGTPGQGSYQQANLDEATANKKHHVNLWLVSYQAFGAMGV